MNYLRKLWCKYFGHKYVGMVCSRCGHVHISRADLLKELLPGLNALFGIEYKKYTEKQDEHHHPKTNG
jgi:hypothetical protein